MKKAIISFFFLILIGLPIVNGIDTSLDGSYVGSANNYLNFFEKLFRGISPQVILGGVNYECRTEYQSINVIANSDGNILISAGPTQITEWIRLEIIDTTIGSIRGGSFIQRNSGITTLTGFIPGRTYSLHLYKCEQSGSTLCAQVTGFLCKNGQITRYTDSCIQSNLKSQGYSVTDTSCGNSNLACPEQGGVKTTADCASTYNTISLKYTEQNTGVKCCKISETPFRPPTTTTTTPIITTTTTTIIPPTTTIPSEIVDFELSDIAIIDPRITINPSSYYYTFKVKNTGNIKAGTQAELFYVSLNHPKFQEFLSQLRGTPTQLQSIFESTTRLTGGDLCKDKGNGITATIPPLNPGQEKEFVIEVRHIKEGTKLDGIDNFNEDGKYLIVLDAYDKCNNPTVYDKIGGTLFFKVDPSGKPSTNESPDCTGTGCIPGGGGLTEKKVIDSTQISLTEKDLEIASSKTIVSAICSVDSNCADYEDFQGNRSYNERCVSTPLIKQKIDESVKESCKSPNLGKLLTGGSIASCATGILLVPVTAGVSFAVGCLAVPIASIGIGGASLAFEAGCEFNAKDKGDGLCIATKTGERFGEGKGITKFIESIGSSINKIFGGAQKTNIPDNVMGGIALGLFIILIVVLLFRK